MFRVKFSLLAAGCLILAAFSVRADDDILTDDVMRTDNGAPLKVIVREDTKLHEEPNEESRFRPVKMFQFFYVLKLDSDAETGIKNDFYRIAQGKKEKDFIGWIHKDKVVEWSHREALGLRPRAGRQLAEFYKSKEDLQAAYTGQKLDPFSKEPDHSGGGVLLVPILETLKIKSEGEDVEAYRVAYLHSRGGKGTSAPAAKVGKIDFNKATLDVVFVIDTTASMQPFIEATKKVVDKIATQIAKTSESVQVRFGLVAYRDVIASPDPDWYVTKLVCDLDTGSDLKKFQEAISSVHEAYSSSEDFPEDVLAGLKMGVEKPKWNPNAFKHIILIGDASAQLDLSGMKNSEKATLEGIIALAQPDGETSIQQKKAIHTVRVVSQAEADHQLCESHFQTLRRGSYEGEYFTFDGQSGAPEFVNQLVETVLKSKTGLKNAVSGNATSIASDTPALGLLLDMIQASEGEGDIPHFASGFTCDIDHDGNSLVEPYVLVENGRLDLFDSALDFTVKAVRNSGEPGSRSVSKLVQNMKNLSTGVILGEEINEKTPLKTILSVILEIPVQNKIFELTPEILAAMSDSDFESWVKQVNSSRDILKQQVSNTKIWFSLDQEVPLQKRFAFISVKDMP